MFCFWSCYPSLLLDTSQHTNRFSSELRSRLEPEHRESVFSGDQLKGLPQHFSNRPDTSFSMIAGVILYVVTAVFSTGETHFVPTMNFMFKHVLWSVSNQRYHHDQDGVMASPVYIKIMTPVEQSFYMNVLFKCIVC